MSRARQGVPANKEPLVHWLEFLFNPDRLRNGGVKLLRAEHLPDLAVEAGPTGEGGRPVNRLTIITGSLALGSYDMEVHFSSESGALGFDRPCISCETLHINTRLGRLAMRDAMGEERVYPLDPASDEGRTERDWAADIVKTMAQGSNSRDASSDPWALGILREFELPHQIDLSVIARVMPRRF